MFYLLDDLIIRYRDADCLGNFSWPQSHGTGNWRVVLSSGCGISAAGTNVVARRKANRNSLVRIAGLIHRQIDGGGAFIDYLKTDGQLQMGIRVSIIVRNRAQALKIVQNFR